MDNIRVLVVDDDQFVQRTLRDTFEMVSGLECVGCCANGADAVEAVAAGGIDVVIMDVHMPVMDGVEATRIIGSMYPGTRVLMWTSFEFDEAVKVAMTYGARGFLLKNCQISVIVNAVRTVHGGMMVLDPEPMAQMRVPARPVAIPALDLTSRQRDILARVCDGQTNAEIGRDLFLSESSVKAQVSALMRKFEVVNRVRLVVAAHEHGLDSR